MPRVDFYVTDDKQSDARLKLACRVAEKGYLAQQRVVVWCQDVAMLTRLDELLWTYRDGSFVPHDPIDDGHTEIEAPVALTTGALPATRHDLLINVSDKVPSAWQRFERIAEILDGAEETRSAGRERFRLYREQGADPETHQIAGPRAAVIRK
ncbi:MAG: DNA polymerase III subunit chi [Pseudomonadales bacterium]|nr:DNA polymerase III subunit chi [Pseudomonadales bacterium]